MPRRGRGRRDVSLLAVNWPVNYLLVGQIVRKKFALKSGRITNWVGEGEWGRQSFGVTESVAMTAYAKLSQSDYYCMGTLRAAAAGLVWPVLAIRERGVKCVHTRVFAVVTHVIAKNKRQKRQKTYCTQSLHANYCITNLHTMMMMTAWSRAKGSLSL